MLPDLACGMQRQLCGCLWWPNFYVKWTGVQTVWLLLPRSLFLQHSSLSMRNNPGSVVSLHIVELRFTPVCSFPLSAAPSRLWGTRPHAMLLCSLFTWNPVVLWASSPVPTGRLLTWYSGMWEYEGGSLCLSRQRCPHFLSSYFPGAFVGAASDTGYGSHEYVFPLTHSRCMWILDKCLPVSKGVFWTSVLIMRGCYRPHCRLEANRQAGTSQGTLFLPGPSGHMELT